jgi:hypothetical protein
MAQDPRARGNSAEQQDEEDRDFAAEATGQTGPGCMEAGCSAISIFAAILFIPVGLLFTWELK